MSKNQANHARDNYAQAHPVLTNDDLLTEILIRLPILCMYLFTLISKQWRRILTSLDFTRDRSQIHNLDPPTGLFVSHITYPFKCDFGSLDSRFQSKKGIVENSFALASTEVVEIVKIVQSCNGLLLCIGPGWPACYYIYNPSTNLFKMLSPPDYSHADSPFYISVGLRMAFDPTKSHNYKVVHAGCTSSHIDIQSYCLETGNWRLCREWFNFFSFDHFDSAIYWNGALYWLETEDIQDGCLLAILRDYISSREFTIYKMGKGCSVWSVRYLVNTDNFMNPLPEGWSIWSSIWSIILGEREEDSCLVINLSRKVVEYNLISKTLHEIYDIGSNQLDDDELIPPFPADHNVYEFILTFASV
ncbi:F-box protein-like protein [Tanacetum coccineum]